MHIKGNLSDSGTITQTVCFQDTEFRRGKWGLKIQSIACNLQDESSSVVILKTNFCQSYVEGQPGIIRVEQSPLLQFTLCNNNTQMQLKRRQDIYPVILFNADHATHWIPVNNSGGEISFSLENAFTGDSIIKNIPVSILCLFKRLA